MFALNHKEEAFDLRNAIYLAKLSGLAYYKADYIATQLPENTLLWSFEEPSDTTGHSTEVFVAGDAETLIIVFRGTETNSSADWVNNLDNRLYPQFLGHVHQGFWEALQQVWALLLAKINLFQDQQQRIWLAGHSQGGALAMLAARSLIEANIPVQGVYTYGQPKVGDMLFASNYNTVLEENTFRIYNAEDKVIQHPTKLYHAGTGVKLEINGTFQIESGFNLLETSSGGLANLLDSLFDYATDNHQAHRVEAYLERLEKSY
ncbi:MAG: hypothetical protein ACFB0B_06100 [Thermonemataceae bacterium]